MLRATAEEVVLIGAGPGDPELLTLKAARLLGQAEVVLYDHLVDARVLELVSAQARLIDVGKIPGGRATAQEVTCALLVKEARAGHRVVRLKGGDPFVFGRGGEEALALQRAGVDFSIVPGVSSCVLAPQVAGIPVTHRGLSTHFTVITGRSARADDPELTRRWEQLGAIGGTLVVLMGVGQLERIVTHVMRGGRAADTPAAMIQEASLPGQRVVSGTLETIVERVRSADLRPPAVLVIGEVAAMHEQLVEALSPEYFALQSAAG